MSNTNSESALFQRSEIFGHPKGLFILFFTEMWERFSYYGMRAILILYLVAPIVDGPTSGLGWEKAQALALYGWYTMLVYVMSIPGGILADKFIGAKKAVMFGGLLLCAGHGILAVDAEWAFFTGLALIVLGVGALKPNISTMVGGLYKPGDIRRDKGFTIFYIGINIGALAASLTVAWVADKYGWHYGFGLAGIGMLLGQLVYVWGQKYLIGIGGSPESSLKKKSSEEDASLGELFSRLLGSPLHLVITVIIIIASCVLSFMYAEGLERYGYSLLGSFIALTAGFLMMVYKDINAIDKDRFAVLLISFAIVIVFWGAFEQAGGLLNLYTDAKIDRQVDLFIWSGEIPTGVFQGANSLFIIIFGIPVAWIWGTVALKGKESSTLFKMALGTIVMGIGFLMMAKASTEAGATGKGALVWLILAYLLHTLGELCASPTALSFITKLAPVKYASLMMGVYFAATGLGNKVAGIVGEAAQSEPIALVAEVSKLNDGALKDSLALGNEQYILKVNAKSTGAGHEIVSAISNNDIAPQIALKNEHSQQMLKNALATYQKGDVTQLPGTITFKKSEEENGVYQGKLEIAHAQSDQEFNTFVAITGFTAIFGLLLLAFLKKLKKLTHGAEDLKKVEEE